MTAPEVFSSHPAVSWLPTGRPLRVQFLQSRAGCSDPNACQLPQKLCDIAIFLYGPDRALFLSMNSTGTDTILGSITWRRIGNRWAATIHSSEGFITIESNSENEALDYAMVASFLLVPWQSSISRSSVGR